MLSGEVAARPSVPTGVGRAARSRGASVPARRILLGVVLGVVLAGGAALRLGLGAERPMWSDEMLRLGWAHGCKLHEVFDVSPSSLCANRPPAGTADVLRVLRSFEPPMAALVHNRWLRTSGARSDLGVRLPAVAFGMLALVGCFLLGRAVMGARAGLALATLVAFSPFHVYYAEELNNYALASCLVVFSYLFYVRWLRAGRGVDAAAYVAVTVAALLTHYYVLCVVGAQLLALPMWTGLRVRPLLRAASPLAVVLGCFALQLPHALEHVAYLGAADRGGYGGIRLLLDRLVRMPLHPWMWWGAALRLPIAEAAALASVMIGLMLWGGSRLPRRWRGVMAVNGVVPFAVVAVAHLVRQQDQVLWPRYELFFTFVPLLAVAAIWARPGWRAREVGAAATVALVLAAGQWTLFSEPPSIDWRTAAATIAREGEPTDVVVGHAPDVVHGLGRYLRGHRMFGIVWPGADDLAAAVAADGRDAVWAVLAWDEGSTARDTIEQELACAYRHRETYTHGAATLIRYHDGPPVPARSHPTECGVAYGFAAPADCAVAPDGTGLRVVGWVGEPVTATLVLTVDGRDAGTATSMPAPPAGAPATPPAVTWFEGDVDVAAVPEGSYFRIGLRSEGTSALARSSLRCVKRSRLAGAGIAGPAFIDGHIDAPARRRRFERGHVVDVAGWAIASRGIERIELEVDGTTVGGTRRHGFQRADVAGLHADVDAAFAGSVGFVGELSTADLAPGPHVLEVVAVHPDGTRTRLASTRRFDVAPRGDVGTTRRRSSTPF